jgi:hypothetical protein
MLTFVVAGGGFAGVETIGALNDFVREAVRYYPNLHEADVRVVLIHPNAVILPELGENLGRYAQRKPASRKVEIRTETRVTHPRVGVSCVVVVADDLPRQIAALRQKAARGTALDPGPVFPRDFVQHVTLHGIEGVNRRPSYARQHPVIPASGEPDALRQDHIRFSLKVRQKPRQRIGMHSKKCQWRCQ